jgi:hypothetical protein
MNETITESYVDGVREEPLKKLQEASRTLCDALAERDRLETRAAKDRFSNWQAYTNAWMKAQKKAEQARVNLRKLLP